MDAINKNTYDDDIEDKKKEEDLNGIPVSEDEPIYAISDFEGRYDYYIRFLMDIGFLNKEQLKNIVMENCNTKEEQEICNAFFDVNPEEFLIDVIYDDKHNKDDKQKYIQQNKTRLEWLIEHFTTDVIKQAINEDFKGKIVVNGDLYSNRIILLLMDIEEYINWPNEKRTISCEDVKKWITDINTSCYNLLKTLNEKLNSDKKDENFFLIAGNHDLYKSDFIKKEDSKDCLKEVKNNSLNGMQLLKFVKFKIGDKTIVFKHSPHLNQDALHTIKRKKYKSVEYHKIRPYPPELLEQNSPLKQKDLYYWKYANNILRKGEVDEKTIFCNDKQDNENINQQLKENNYYMVFGHCGITATNLSTFSIIDKDWDTYRYSKFSIDKQQLRHEVYNAKNKIIKIYSIKNFEKAKRRDEKINNKKLSIVSNNEIYFQKQKKNSQQQQKHFDALKISNENSLSINNKVPKRGMGSQTKNKTEASKRQRIEFTYNDVDSSNSVCGLNACCKLIGNTCG